MPHRRILGLEGKPSIYHCMTRTVAGQFLIKDPEKEVLRDMLRKVAEFCGVHLLTYAILDNHFHVLVSVPDRAQVETAVTNSELIRRYRILYPKPTRFRPALICVLEEKLNAAGEAAVGLRRSLLDRMHDVSEFMKTVKQRFSLWFNHTHERFGTLWAERFRSVLIEGGRREALLVVAAYIDLNPVRAGIVTDPKDYRWSGYGQATAGDSIARQGLIFVLEGGAGEAEGNGWSQFAAEYRLLLFGTGAKQKEGAASITDEQFATAVVRRGHLSWFDRLSRRSHTLMHGAVLGSQVFVLEQLARYRERTGRRQYCGPQPLADLSRGLFSMRGFRPSA